MSNVKDFPGVTRHTTPVNKILATAAAARLQDIVIIGFRENGELYFASSSPDGGDCLWLLENAKYELLAAVRGQ